MGCVVGRLEHRVEVSQAWGVRACKKCMHRMCVNRMCVNRMCVTRVCITRVCVSRCVFMGCALLGCDGPPYLGRARRAWRSSPASSPPAGASRGSRRAPCSPWPATDRTCCRDGDEGECVCVGGGG